MLLAFNGKLCYCAAKGPAEDEAFWSALVAGQADEMF